MPMEIIRMRIDMAKIKECFPLWSIVIKKVAIKLR
jgi:hypothetical protein